MPSSPAFVMPFFTGATPLAKAAILLAKLLLLGLEWRECLPLPSKDGSDAALLLGLASPVSAAALTSSACCALCPFSSFISLSSVSTT
ncbi:hypothetical protein COO60DRAFT_1498204 [Scenedesmus sp. NREL 46B-D3]|nr:hypothetical protein COO60DRAFT_1498204 [Scenedesmus sp. NREL 46B-D3]